jgi:phosphomethylpyrimidine synthase
MEEYCGVLGIFSKNNMDLKPLLYDGLQSLQHRGQEGAGIVWSYNSGLKSRHKLGLCSNLFSSDFNISGNISIGHLRYSTSSNLNKSALGPLLSSSNKFALAHNGHLKVSTLGDVDTLEAVRILEHYDSNNWANAFRSFDSELDGSYAFVFMTSDRLIGMRDPRGIRPLVLGSINDSIWILASESCAIESMGGKFIRMIEPGEIVEINSQGLKSYKSSNTKIDEELCAFEYIYFSRADSIINNKCVHEFRFNSGIELSRKFNFPDADIVIGAPDSGIPAAMGYASGSKFPFVDGFIKNHYMGRTFIEPESNIRKKRLKLKLNVLKYNVSNKNVVLVDDSLVRGNTSKYMIESLKSCGAKNVYFLLASPPITSPCYLGIDTKTHDELLAYNKSLDEIKISLGADALGFLDINDLNNIAGSNQLCKKCFNSNFKGDLMMRNYTTQMDAAKKGIVTLEMQKVAKKEGIDENILMERIAKGTIALPANIHHSNLEPEAVGEGLRTKINVNLGISKDAYDIDAELEKAQKAIELKAEAIMDLSNYGKTEEFRKRLVDMSPAMIGTVPVYDALGFYEKELKDIKSEDFLKVVEKHALDGVDFVTIHVGMNKKTAQRFKDNPRLTNIVSRGGSLMFAWMLLHDAENPFYEYYDELLDICAAHDVTLSLGDACRPGCIADSTDASQIEELITLGELTKRAWEKNVQVIIEGPGHMKLDEVKMNMALEKKLCHGAPFYVLGPIVTDVAPGYDHITGAIGGAIAAASGADFLCYVTPAEHLRLPTIDDMKEGIMASKIAAHAGDLCKKTPNADLWDYEMSEARKNLDWNKMFELALDPEKAKEYRASSIPEDENSCSMCGKMCPMRNIKKVLNGEDVGIL